MYEFPVTKSDRLDRLLRSAKISPWLSRQAWEEALHLGAVKVNGRVTRKPGDTISVGSTVQVELPELGLLADETPAELVWEDSARGIAVFNKGVGIPTYPLYPWERGTLANGLCRLAAQRGLDFASLGDAPILEGGLLQRLDRDTSGLVTTAFTKEAKALYRQVFSGQVNKGYLAILTGDAEGKAGEQEIFFPVSESAKVTAFLTSKAGAKPVRLKIKIIQSHGGFSLVEVETSHGLRHVVRAGMAALGLPLAGDALYGGAADFSFHQLHAHALRIPEFAPIRIAPPQSFLDCLKACGLHYPG